jgi:hypothetical protein
LGFQFPESGIESWSKQILFAIWKLIEDSPEEIHVGAFLRVDASGSAYALPNQFQPGSESLGGLGCAEVGSFCRNVENAPNGDLCVCVEEMETLTRQFRDRA